MNKIRLVDRHKSQLCDWTLKGNNVARPPVPVGDEHLILPAVVRWQGTDRYFALDRDSLKLVPTDGRTVPAERIATYIEIDQPMIIGNI